MAVGIRHQFVAFLGSCIKTDGVIYILISRKRNLYRVSIYTGTAGIQQFGYLMMTTRLQYIHKTCNVAIYIGHWILDTIPNSRLGTQVNNTVKTIVFKQLW